jgi:alkyl sulfatase BDS1-like metallo-beta-lactamase superfamily hydrolase
LNHSAGKQAENPDATIITTRKALNQILTSQAKLAEQIGAGETRIQRRKEAFGELLSLMDKFDLRFNIVTP